MKTFLNKNLCGDAYFMLQQFPPDSVDLIATDPPYGYSFMNRSWDKRVPSVEVLKECLRVMKPGAFGFFMSSPRQDVLSEMLLNLRLAGFNMQFSSIYWTYATGFPKAANISKMIDKKLGVEPAVVREKSTQHNSVADHKFGFADNTTIQDTVPQSDDAKKFAGAYGGFQPKPAVEIIIVAMKPMTEKSFIGQALQNGKGVTWMDNARIPYTDDTDKESSRFGTQPDIRGGNLMDHQGVRATDVLSSEKGRFPANMLVSDDVLNDGKEHVTAGISGQYPNAGFGGSDVCFGANAKDNSTSCNVQPDSGSYSRYFDLDAWFEQCAKHIPDAQWETFPFLIVPKPAMAEKNYGLQADGTKHTDRENDSSALANRLHNKTKKKNFHPTVKPITLMSYLIALGSREGDTVLDPWVGSGTSCIAAKMLCRSYIGIDDNPEYIALADARLKAVKVQLKMF